MNTTSRVLRVLLADDHTLVRAGVRALLERQGGIEVVGEVGDGHEVIRQGRELRPDIVLMDIGMPGMNGLEATSRMSRELPEVRIIVFSMHRQEEYVWQALKAGAMGYLLKDAAAAELSQAIQAVARGEVYLCRAIASRLPHGLALGSMTARGNRLERLTPRQREILQLIAEGQTTKGIADVLGISAKTVEYHRLKLMESLGIHDVPGLVRFAMKAGIVSQEA